MQCVEEVVFTSNLMRQIVAVFTEIEWGYIPPFKSRDPVFYDVFYRV
jgi:hypothetical protein